MLIIFIYWFRFCFGIVLRYIGLLFFVLIYFWVFSFYVGVVGYLIEYSFKRLVLKSCRVYTRDEEYRVNMYRGRSGVVWDIVREGWRWSWFLGKCGENIMLRELVLVFGYLFRKFFISEVYRGEKELVRDFIFFFLIMIVKNVLLN